MDNESRRSSSHTRTKVACLATLTAVMLLAGACGSTTPTNDVADQATDTRDDASVATRRTDSTPPPEPEPTAADELVDEAPEPAPEPTEAPASPSGQPPASSLSIEDMGRLSIEQNSHVTLWAPQDLQRWLEIESQILLPDVSGRPWTPHVLLCTNTGRSARYRVDQGNDDAGLFPYLWEHDEMIANLRAADAERERWAPDESDDVMITQLEGDLRAFELYLIPDGADFGASTLDQMLADPSPNLWPVPEGAEIHQVVIGSFGANVVVDASGTTWKLPSVSSGLHRVTEQCLDDPTSFDAFIPPDVLAGVGR